MSKQELSQVTGSKLNEPSINTIMTMVVRIKQPMTVKLLSGRECDIVWNNQYSEPEVIEPGTTEIKHRGIMAVIAWLQSLRAVTEWYAQTKHHKQPND